MKTRLNGTFVIPWANTETGGTRGASLVITAVGVTWRWSGAPVRVDGPQGLLVLEGAQGMQVLHRRAARMVQRLIGVGVKTREKAEPDLPHQSFVVTDGVASFVITVVAGPETGIVLGMVLGALPPVNRDLWVVRVALDGSQIARPVQGSVICFTQGTWLDTPDGPRLVEGLRQGDKVLTRDNGAQLVLWRGQRHMTGARLHAMPQLRPIRFRHSAMGMDRPDQDLLVSPHHRMLVKGPAARALFNSDEVLVQARDLINDRTVRVDYTLREVTYVHILLPHHNVIWANGLETESFHPGHAALDAAQHADLTDLLGL